jgi:hypothetical protein
MSKRRDIETINNNEQTFNLFYTRLRLLAVSRFQWVNLPKTMDERFLEKVLCDMGNAAIVNDPLYGVINTRITYGGSLNIYENPVTYTCWSLGYSKQFPADKVIRVRNNYLDIPTDFIIRQYCKRIANAERTSDINLDAQKTCETGESAHPC